MRQQQKLTFLKDLQRRPNRSHMFRRRGFSEARTGTGNEGQQKKQNTTPEVLIKDIASCDYSKCHAAEGPAVFLLPVPSNAPSAWISTQTGYESGSPPEATSRRLVAALQAPSSRPGVSYAPVLRWPRLSISQRFHPGEPVSLFKFTTF